VRPSFSDQAQPVACLPSFLCGNRELGDEVFTALATQCFLDIRSNGGSGTSQHQVDVILLMSAGILNNVYCKTKALLLYDTLRTPLFHATLQFSGRAFLADHAELRIQNSELR